jgi:hypothetical protein
LAIAPHQPAGQPISLPTPDRFYRNGFSPISVPASQPVSHSAGQPISLLSLQTPDRFYRNGFSVTFCGPPAR